MGLTNSELLEELILICYKENIIEEVREEVRNILETNTLITQYEAYEMAYKKFKKNN
jgi:hypothetical protein